LVAPEMFASGGASQINTSTSEGGRYGF